ncbi:ABC transporter ATP-binding protein [candidate division WOR-3 bacterium]|nr:ABC transporter ATP-binding protein [candidate division WOR-3 bacterium]
MEDRRQVILLQNLKKTYKDGGIPVEAVRGISLEFERGEFTAIVGPSGSGKTTLMNLMAGLDSPTEGSVFLDGQLISGMKGAALADFRRDNIGFVFQSYNLIPVLTVSENVEFILLLQGVDKKKRRNRITEVLTEVGLENFSDRLVSRLSGGQQQRVAVARAIAANPKIILADEPTANLDSENSINLVNLMLEMNQKHGSTFIFSTHDSLIVEKAKRVLTLKDGKIYSDEKK